MPCGLERTDFGVWHRFAYEQDEASAMKAKVCANTDGFGETNTFAVRDARFSSFTAPKAFIFRATT